MTILGTGLTGLIGTRIVELLKDTYTFENISRSEGIDITDKESVYKAIEKSSANTVLHLAAYTDVKKAEAEKGLGEKSEAWQINVIGTENIASACQKIGKKCIYISTDLVFDGQNTPEGGYRETDVPHPLSWYATTKYEGEKRVSLYGNNFIILRIAYPYRAQSPKIDFVRLFIQKLQDNEELPVLSDRIITPTFIDDIVHAVQILIRQNVSGIYHVVGSESLSILDCASDIAQAFSLNQQLIHATTREEFLEGRAPEPFNSSLNNGKIISLGVRMRGFNEGLEEIKSQMLNVKSTS